MMTTYLVENGAIDILVLQGQGQVDSICSMAIAFLHLIIGH